MKSHRIFGSRQIVASAALVLGVVLPWGAPAAAQSAASAGESSGYALQADLLRLVQASGRNSEWGVLAVSLENGDTLVAIEPDRTLAPASNQKLFTTAAALHHLGAEYRFPTYLLTEGSVQEGVLEGDLILYGTGDPALSDRYFRSATDPLRDFARALLAEGIHTVTGQVVGDGSFFHGPTRRPSWPGQDNAFAAAVSALTFNDNIVTLRIVAGADGEAASLLTIPEGLGFEVINRSRTVAANPGRRLFLIRDDPDDPIELRGDMTVGQRDIWREITVPDPVNFTAAVFRQVLEEEGIRVLGGARPVGPDDRSSVTGTRLSAPGFVGRSSPTVRTVAVHYSPPLEELLGVMNRVSHNLHSEILLFTLGRVVHGDGSFDGGTRALKDYLVRVAGVREDDLELEDGSGLSSDNQATASSFVRLLTHVASAEYAESFWATLPEAGNRLELARMYQSPAAGNLRAKTGTIRRVSALTGVVRAADGEAILFSIVSNGVPSTSTAKRIEDQIGIRLASFRRDPLPAKVRVALVEYGEHGPRVLSGPVGGATVAASAATSLDR